MIQCSSPYPPATLATGSFWREQLRTGTNWNLFRNGQLAGHDRGGYHVPGDNGAAWMSRMPGPLVRAGWTRISSGRASSLAAGLPNRPFSTPRSRPSEIAALYNADLSKPRPCSRRRFKNPGTVFHRRLSVLFDLGRGQPHARLLVDEQRRFHRGVTATNYAINNLQGGNLHHRGDRHQCLWDEH